MSQVIRESTLLDLLDLPEIYAELLQYLPADSEKDPAFFMLIPIERKKELFNAAGDDIRLKAIRLSHVPIANQIELFLSINDKAKQVELFSNLNRGQQIKLLQNLINTNPQFETTNNVLYNQLIGKMELGEANAEEELKKAENKRYRAIEKKGLVGRYNGKMHEIENPYEQAREVYEMELAKAESKRRVIEFLLHFGFTNFSFNDFKLVLEACKNNPCEKMKTKVVRRGGNHPVTLPSFKEISVPSNLTSEINDYFRESGRGTTKKNHGAIQGFFKDWYKIEIDQGVIVTTDEIIAKRHKNAFKGVLRDIETEAVAQPT